MRTTQYIGLNAAAGHFVKNLKPVKDVENFTEGMFMEKIPLGVWDDDKGNRYIEVQQCAPWSSGPMIMTCLISEVTQSKMFQWVEDEAVKDTQVDFINGTYWV